MTGWPCTKHPAAQTDKAIAGRSTPTGRTECGPQMPGSASRSAVAAAETCQEAPVPVAHQKVPPASSGHESAHTPHQSLMSAPQSAGRSQRRLNGLATRTPWPASQ